MLKAFQAHWTAKYMLCLHVLQQSIQSGAKYSDSCHKCTCLICISLSQTGVWKPKFHSRQSGGTDAPLYSDEL